MTQFEMWFRCLLSTDKSLTPKIRGGIADQLVREAETRFPVEKLIAQEESLQQAKEYNARNPVKRYKE